MPKQKQTYYLSQVIRRYFSSQNMFYEILDDYLDKKYDFTKISKLTKEPIGFKMPGELYKLKEFSKKNLSLNSSSKLIQILDADISSIFHTARATQEYFYKIIKYDSDNNYINMKYNHLFNFENINQNISDISKLFDFSNILIKEIIKDNKEDKLIFYSFCESLGKICNLYGKDKTNKMINEIYDDSRNLIENYINQRRKDGFLEISAIIEKNNQNYDLKVFNLLNPKENIYSELDDENQNLKQHNSLEINLPYYYKEFLFKFNKSKQKFTEFYEKFKKTNNINNEEYVLFDNLSKEPDSVLIYNPGILYELKKTSHIIKIIQQRQFDNKKISEKEFFDSSTLDSITSILFHTARATKEEAYRKYKSR